MLLDEDPRGQTRLGLTFEHRDRGLEHDRPSVHALVDEVDGRARDLDAVLERLALGMKPGPKVGEILKAIYEQQLDGKITTTEEGIELAKTLAQVRSTKYEG